MQLDLLSKKKFPRLFLALTDEIAQPLAGAHFVWPDRSVAAILDMSYAGIAISSARVLNKIKIGDAYEGKIRLESTGEAIPLKLRAIRLTAKSIGFVINTMSVSGRLVIEQAEKDNLVAKNIRSLPATHLHPALQADHWFHGPFDSNIFLWQKEGKVEKAVIEYDNLLLIYEHGKINLQKSVAASDEARGYEAPLLEATGNVSMGASWLDRLVKLLDRIDSPPGQLIFMTNILRAQRQN